MVLVDGKLLTDML